MPKAFNFFQLLLRKIKFLVCAKEVILPILYCYENSKGIFGSGSAKKAHDILGYLIQTILHFLLVPVFVLKSQSIVKNIRPFFQAQHLKKH